tara:strand:- start:1639 stop:2346 length:708 start_codon:yes stop_codon:yes gene_type:complete
MNANSPPIEWLLFDVGNTLLEEGAALEDRDLQLTRLAQRLRPQITNVMIKNAIEAAWAAAEPEPLEAAMRAVLGPFAARARQLLNQVNYRSDLERPYKDAPQILGRLRETYRLGVIANQQPGLKKRLERFGLAAHIAVCIGSGDVGLWKPNPRIFQLALQEAGCVPQRAVMIGDRPDKDIQPARRLGMSTIRLLQGPAGSQKANANNRADVTVDSLSEVQEAVERLRFQGVTPIP